MANDIPSIPDIITSEIIKSGNWTANCCNASSALLNDMTLYESTNISVTNHNMEGSSSIIMIICLFLSYSVGVFLSSTKCSSNTETGTSVIFVSIFSIVISIDGNNTSKVVISFGTLETRICPFNRFTILWQIASPKPLRGEIPFLFCTSKLSRILYRSNIFGKSTSLIPFPLLEIRMQSCSSFIDNSTLIIPFSGVYLKAFEIRLLAILFKQLTSVFQKIFSSICKR